jgi:hypothetical protein
MDILILHRIPYDRIQYHRGIDHAAHRVTYIGKAEALANLPHDLPCTRVERAGIQSTYEEVCAWLAQQSLVFDRIVSMSEYELLDAARLRQRFNVPGASVEQVALVRNKVLMKGAVSRAGLRVPDFMPLQAFLDDHRSARWRGKTVLKPHSGASSVDITSSASRSAMAASPTRRITRSRPSSTAPFTITTGWCETAGSSP